MEKSRRKRKNFMCNEITINVKRNEIRRYVRHKERHNRRVFTVLSSANSSKNRVLVEKGDIVHFRRIIDVSTVIRRLM